MLWLNDGEVFQVLDRLAKSSDSFERSYFGVLAAEAMKMVRHGWNGIEAPEWFLDPPVKASVKPSSISVVDLDGTTTTLPTWPPVAAAHITTLRTLAEFREFVYSHNKLGRRIVGLHQG